MDPNDLYSDGQPKPVIDLMFPWGSFQETILREYVVVDQETQHRIPRLEAALVSKYAAMVSEDRDRADREQDAGDFRRMVRANRERIDCDVVRQLGDELWEGGGNEILQFLDIAFLNQPFPS
jgi:hypothetical protein